MEIYNHFSVQPQADSVQEKRNILVRVIKSTDTSRNRIIKATNNQTKVPSASLRATDPLQEKIEDYFQANDYYYERRKNYYKNLKKPKSRIVSITFLAQAVMAVVLQEPNNSRGRPSTLLSDDDDYQRVFDPEYPLALFLECVKFMKLVDDFLRSDDAPRYISGNESNIRFQLAMFVAVMKAGRLRPRPSSIPNISLDEVDKTFFRKCVRHVWEVFGSFRKTQKFTASKISKSPDFDQALKDRLREILVDETTQL
jgi:hypothetical protein